MDYIKLRQRMSGELRWVAAVSRQDICARPARIATKINALCGGDAYRINELFRVAKDWQQAAVLNYAASSHPRGALGRGDKVQGVARKRGERVHGGLTALVGWADAAFGDQLAEGKFRLDYVIGLMSSTQRGPRHILQRASKFARKMVKSSLGGEVYALSDMADHMLLLRNCGGIDLPVRGSEPGRLRKSTSPPQYREDGRRKVSGTPFFEYPAGPGGR